VEEKWRAISGLVKETLSIPSCEQEEQVKSSILDQIAGLTEAAQTWRRIVYSESMRLSFLPYMLRDRHKNYE